MNNEVKFKFALEVELPCAGQIRCGDSGTADLIVVGVCDIENVDEMICGEGNYLYPCNIFAWGCVNPISDTPLSAWFPIRTSDVKTDRAKFRDFYEGVELAINDDYEEKTITDYDRSVIAYFTQPVKVEKITTYAAAH